MAQLLDPVPNDQKRILLCCYVNATSHIQVARITNIPNWYFERVVFPGQRLVFEALPHAQLEIHTGMMASSILSDKIPCERLCISDEGDEDDFDDLDLMPVLEPVDHHPLEPLVSAFQMILSKVFSIPLKPGFT